MLTRCLWWWLHWHFCWWQRVLFLFVFVFVFLCFCFVGCSPYRGPVSTTGSPPQPLWNQSLAPELFINSVSTPVVTASGTAVFSAWSAQNRGGEGATYVVGANVTTGDVVWSMRVGTGYLAQVSLTQDGFALFGHGNASGVTCVHGDTGAVRWTSVLDTSFVPVITVDDDSQRAYVIPCACAVSAHFCLCGAGVKLCTASMRSDNARYPTRNVPRPAPLSRARACTSKPDARQDGFAYGLNVTDGDIVWRVPCENTYSTVAPTVLGDTLVVGTGWSGQHIIAFSMYVWQSLAACRCCC